MADQPKPKPKPVVKGFIVGAAAVAGLIGARLASGWGLSGIQRIIVAGLCGGIAGGIAGGVIALLMKRNK